jgi:hypothetical protein
MAYEIPVQILSFTAASAMSAATNQFCFVELASNGKVHLANATTDVPIGVLQNLPGLGEVAEVMVLGVTKVRVGGTDISAPGLIGTDATARAAVYVTAGTGTASFIVGRVIEVGGTTNNDGALVTALINCANPGRGV